MHSRDTPVPFGAINVQCRSRVQGFSGLGFGGQSLGNQGLGVGVYGLGFEVWGLGFRVT